MEGDGGSLYLEFLFDTFIKVKVGPKEQIEKKCDALNTFLWLEII